MVTAAGVLEVLRSCEFRYCNEDDLQAGLAGALTNAGLDVQREVRLTARDRIDLLVDAVGIEVKIAGRTADVIRQLNRYLKSELIEELILVTSRARHQIELPADAPVHIHQVLRPW